MLANRLCTFLPKFTPITLRTHHNILTSDLVQVLKEFCHRLTALYSAPNQTNTEDINSFLNHLSLPMLSADHTALMDQDIQVSQVLRCIKGLKVGKRPGLEVFMALYYRKLADVLAPHLSAMFNSVKKRPGLYTRPFDQHCDATQT